MVTNFIGSISSLDVEKVTSLAHLNEVIGLQQNRDGEEKRDTK
jgi:hypothetical protein